MAAPWVTAFPKQARKLARHSTESRKRRQAIRAKKPRKRLNQISKQRRQNLKQYAAIKRAWKGEFGNHRCIVSGAPQVEIHHTWGRIGALLCLSRLWLPVSRKVHDWINANPKTAAAVGLLCPAGRYNEVPMEWEAKAQEYRLGILRAYIYGVASEEDAVTTVQRPQGLATVICAQVETEVAAACKSRFWEKLK